MSELGPSLPAEFTAALKPSWTVRMKLSLLWFLEWGITGAILTYLPIYFIEKGLDQDQLGQLFAVTAVGLWIAPLVVGQICDRWFSSEKYLGLVHLLGGMVLIVIPAIAEHFEATHQTKGFPLLLFSVGFYAAVYFPTIPLVSSLSFRHLPKPEEQFGSVRIWGTVGWVLSGFVVSIWLGQTEFLSYLKSQFPEWESLLVEIENRLADLPQPNSSHCFYIAATLSFLLTGLCFFLPETPPAPTKRFNIAPWETLKTFTDKNTLLLIAVSFCLAIVVPFYIFAVPKLVSTMLSDRGISDTWVPAVMTIGQISEFPALLLLSMLLRKYGLKITFALGMAAWFLRYLLFAVTREPSMVYLGIALNGICHVFLIVVIQLYVDSRCRQDLKASAQNLFAFLTLGIASPLGFRIAGKLGDFCHLGDAEEANYFLFFTVPAFIVLVLLLLFLRWFQTEKIRTNPSLVVERA